MPTRERPPVELLLGSGFTPRSTWFYWRQTGKGTRVIKLPNGQLRVRRSALGQWLGELKQDAA